MASEVGLIELGVVRVVLVDAVNFTLEDARGGLPSHLRLTRIPQRLLVLCECCGERGRARKQSILQRLQHELGRHLLCVTGSSLEAHRGVFLECLVNRPLFIRVRNFDWVEFSFREPWRAVPLRR